MRTGLLGILPVILWGPTNSVSWASDLTIVPRCSHLSSRGDGFSLQGMCGAEGSVCHERTGVPMPWSSTKVTVDVHVRPARPGLRAAVAAPAWTCRAPCMVPTRTSSIEHPK